MDNKEYLLNEVGLEIAKENIAKQMRKLMENQKDEELKNKIQQIIKDRDEIEKGNIEIIKKYLGELNIE